MAVATQYLRLGLVQLMGKHAIIWKNGKFSHVCRNKSNKGNFLYVSHNEATGNASDTCVGLVVSGDEETNQQWNQKLRVGNCSVKFKVDTGSDTSVVSDRQYRKMKPTPTLEKSHAVMKSYSGTQMPSIGVCRVSVQYKKRNISTYIEVVRDEGRPALLSDCEKLGIVKWMHAIEDEQKGDITPTVV